MSGLEPFLREHGLVGAAVFVLPLAVRYYWAERACMRNGPSQGEVRR